MAENRTRAQREKLQTIRYHAGDGQLYRTEARSVFIDPTSQNGAEGARYTVHGNTAAAPQRAEPVRIDPPQPDRPQRPRPAGAPRKRQKRLNPIEWFRQQMKVGSFRRNVYLSGGAALVTILAMASILLGLSWQYTDTVNEITKVESDIELCRKENEALKTKIVFMFSKREVETYAENVLHMVRSNVFNTVSITLTADSISAVPGSAAGRSAIEELPAAFGDGAEIAGIVPAAPATEPSPAMPIVVQQTPDADG